MNKNIEEIKKYIRPYIDGIIEDDLAEAIQNLLTQQREEAVKTTFEEIGDGMVRAYRGCECCGVTTSTVHTKEELDILSQQREKGKE